MYLTALSGQSPLCMIFPKICWRKSILCEILWEDFTIVTFFLLEVNIFLLSFHWSPICRKHTNGIIPSVLDESDWCSLLLVFTESVLELSISVILWTIYPPWALKRSFKCFILLTNVFCIISLLFLLISSSCIYLFSLFSLLFPLLSSSF